MFVRLMPTTVNIPLVAVPSALSLVLGVPAVGMAHESVDLLQREAEDGYLGRFSGAFVLPNALMMIVGGLAAGTLVDLTGTVPLLDASAGPYLGAGVLAAFLLRATEKQTRGNRANEKGAGENPTPSRVALSAGCASAHYRPVDREQYDRAYRGDDDGPDKTATPEADQACQEAAHESPRDTDKDRHDDAAWIVAWHNQLG